MKHNCVAAYLTVSPVPVFFRILSAFEPKDCVNKRIPIKLYISAQVNHYVVISHSSGQISTAGNFFNTHSDTTMSLIFQTDLDAPHEAQRISFPIVGLDAA